ncbi:MAG: AAC(3) family N-acetyltransferase [Micromonosporaceae bacterium]|nr:AAC(3) family N-acetyltransferase [Micromonosporaceae bacterium]
MITRTVGVQPVGRAQLVEDLVRLGVAASQSILVHSSMRRYGPVEGGPATVVAALRDAIGPQATLVVPTHTANNSTTSDAFRRATRGMTPAEAAAYEASLAGFDPAVTSSFGMGSVAEYVRTHPGAVRSRHPQTSFAALGPDAAAWMAVHDLDCHLGERSPLGALYRADVGILLLGVGYESCTALHLAEYRLPWPPPRQRYRCYWQEGGTRRRVEFEAPRLDASDFALIGADLDTQPFVRSGRFGHGQARAIRLRAAVDFSVAWMRRHRRR